MMHQKRFFTFTPRQISTVVQDTMFSVHRLLKSFSLALQVNQHYTNISTGLKGEIIIRQSQQQLSGLGVTGVVVWDSCIHLSMLMCQYFKAALNNKVVLELGSGCGLAGLVASRLGAKRVILTDQEQMQHILKQNIALNTANNTKKPFGIVEHRVLEWGEELPDLPKIDVVICSDCIYNEAIIDVFICTIEELLQQAEYALFAQELRSHYVIAELLEKVMAKGLLVWRVPECAGEGTSTGVVVYVISRSVMTCVNVEFT